MREFELGREVGSELVAIAGVASDTHDDVDQLNTIPWLEQLPALGARCRAHLAQDEYTEALTCLAGLREPVDAFFDDVMVMAEDVTLRNNRMGILQEVSGLFKHIADFTKI